MFTKHICSCGDCYCSNKKKFSNGEKQKGFFIENLDSSNICQITIDNCFETSKTLSKCDCLYSFSSTKEPNLIKKLLFVEFKGKNFEHGIKQLEDTYIRMKSMISTISPIPEVRAIIISPKCPMTSSEVKKLKLDFLRKHKISFSPEKPNFVHKHNF